MPRSLAGAFGAYVTSAVATVAVAATADGNDEDDLFDMSLEELINLEISSVSKSTESVRETAAAAHVITATEIRRSGARSLPEVLKLAPGLDVARINSGSWAVSSRGFNGRFANKLLVLIDGRSIYSSIYAGVFWDAQTTFLENIERIEVIRGPGAAIWGPNAVNGVVNVITKTSSETEGVLAFGDVSDAGDYRTGARIGHRVSDALAFRLSASAEATSEFRTATRDPRRALSSTDDYDRRMVSGRVDWRPDETNAMTIIGQITKGDRSELIRLPTNVSGVASIFDDVGDFGMRAIQGGWEHTGSNGRRFELGGAYERVTRTELGGSLEQNAAQLTADFHSPVLRSHKASVGLYAFYDDTSFETSSLLNVDPPMRTTLHYGGYIHTEWEVVPEHVRIFAGSTFEDNDFTGFEIQPSLRAHWSLSDYHSVWAGVSRSVRTPSRFDYDFSTIVDLVPAGSVSNPLPLPGVITTRGNKSFESQSLMSYELGYRAQFSERISVDLAGFINRYRDLQSLSLLSPEMGFAFGQPAVVLPIQVQNAAEAEGGGLEIAANWLAANWVRFTADYAYLDLDVRLENDAEEPQPAIADYLVLGSGQTPEHRASIRSAIDIGERMEVDGRIGYRSQIRGQNGPIKDYFDVTARVAYKVRDGVELSVLGQQLTDESRLEMEKEFAVGLPVEAERRIFVRLQIQH